MRQSISKRNTELRTEVANRYRGLPNRMQFSEHSGIALTLLEDLASEQLISSATLTKINHALDDFEKSVQKPFFR